MQNIKNFIGSLLGRTQSEVETAQPPADLTGRKFDERLARLQPAVRLEPVPDGTKPHWRLLEARWADRTEGGRGYIFVRANNEQGLPLEGVTFQADRGNAVDRAQTKAAIDNYTGNIMMTGLLGTYKVSMLQDGLPSDKLVNVGLGNLAAPRETVPTSFFLTFQKSPGVQAPPPVPTPTPPPPPTPTGPRVEPPSGAPTLREAILTASRAYLLPVNRDAPLFKYAKAHNLGDFLSAEFSVTHQGVEYRVQGFQRGIVFARADKPDAVSHLAYP
jgi:hypothetical protein